MRITCEARRPNVSVIQVIETEARSLHLSFQIIQYYGHVNRRQGKNLEKLIM